MNEPFSYFKTSSFNLIFNLKIRSLSPPLGEGKSLSMFTHYSFYGCRVRCVCKDSIIHFINFSFRERCKFKWIWIQAFFPFLQLYTKKTRFPFLTYFSGYFHTRNSFFHPPSLHEYYKKSFTSIPKRELVRILNILFETRHRILMWK